MQNEYQLREPMKDSRGNQFTKEDRFTIARKLGGGVRVLMERTSDKKIVDVSGSQFPEFFREIK